MTPFSPHLRSTYESEVSSLDEGDEELDEEESSEVDAFPVFCAPLMSSPPLLGTAVTPIASSIAPGRPSVTLAYVS